MEKIDNSEIIFPMLGLLEENGNVGTEYFYKAEIMLRRKEHPGLGSDSKIVKTYFFDNKESLRKLYDLEVKPICDALGARCYIYLNPRSFRDVAFECLSETAKSIKSLNYKGVMRAYNTACGKTCSSKACSKKWLIDVDSKDEAFVTFAREMVWRCGGEILAEIPTRNGVHIVTKPFELLDLNFKKEAAVKRMLKVFGVPSGTEDEWLTERFGENYAEMLDVDIHKDNGTVLYAPERKED